MGNVDVAYQLVTEGNTDVAYDLISHTKVFETVDNKLLIVLCNRMPRSEFERIQNYCERCMQEIDKYNYLEKISIMTSLLICLGILNEQTVFTHIDRCQSLMNDQNGHGFDQNHIDLWLTKYHNLVASHSAKFGKSGQVQSEFEKALFHAERCGYTKYISAIKINLGEMFRLRNKIDKAREMYDDAADINKILQDPSLTAFLNLCYSQLYQTRGRTKTAIQKIEEAITIYETLDLPHYLVQSYFQYSILLLQSGFSDVNSYLLKLQSYRIQARSSVNTLTVLEGMIRKHENRMRSKSQAQGIFEKVLSELDNDVELKIFTSLQLIDILFDEYKMYQNQDVRVEIEFHLYNAYKLAQKVGFVKTIAEILVIKAKLAFLQSKFEDVSFFLNQAQYMARENNIVNIIEIANLEWVIDNIFRVQPLHDYGMREQRKMDSIDFKHTSQTLISKNLNLKYLLNPVRMGILKLLYKNVELSSVEIKEGLNISWNEYTNHSLSLKKSGYVRIEDGFIDGSIRQFLFIEPKGIEEFKGLIEYLHSFITSPGNLLTWLEHAMEKASIDYSDTISEGME